MEMVLSVGLALAVALGIVAFVVRFRVVILRVMAIIVASSVIGLFIFIGFLLAQMMQG